MSRRSGTSTAATEGDRSLVGIALNRGPSGTGHGVEFITSSNGTDRQDDVKCSKCFDSLLPDYKKRLAASELHSLFSAAHAKTHFDDLLGIEPVNPDICLLSAAARTNKEAAISAYQRQAESAWASHSEGGEFRLDHKDSTASHAHEVSRIRCSVM